MSAEPVNFASDLQGKMTSKYERSLTASLIQKMQHYGHLLWSKGLPQLFTTLVILQVIGFLQRLLLTKYFLSVEEIGQFSVFIHAFNFFITFAFMNASATLLRYLPSRPTWKKHYFLAVIILSVCSWTIAILGYHLLRYGFNITFFSQYNQKIFDRYIYFTLGMLFFPLIINFFVATEKIKLRAKFELLFRCCLFGLLMIGGYWGGLRAILWTFSLYHMVIPMVVGVIIYRWLITRPNNSEKSGSTLTQTLKQTLTIAWFEFIILAPAAFSESFDVFILDKTLGDQTLNGYYATAKIFISIVMMSSYAIIQVFSANLSQKESPLATLQLYKKIVFLCLAIYAGYLIAGNLLASPLMGFMGHRYLNAVPTFRWLLVGACFKGLLFINLSTLFYLGHLKARMVFALTDAFLFIATTYFCLTQFSYMGMVRAYGISAAIVFIGSLFYLIRLAGHQAGSDEQTKI